MQGDKGFEVQPTRPSDHALLLFKQKVQLLQGALGGLAAALALLCGRVSSLASTLSGACLQLPHEVFIYVLAESVTGCLVNGSWRLGPGGPREPEARDLGGGAGVCRQAINSTVKGIAKVLVPSVLRKKDVGEWLDQHNN